MLGLGLSLPTRAVLGGSFSPRSLFAAGEIGAWYDPSDLTTLFQDTAGTQPVTTPGQRVALMLDKSQGLTLGPELVTNGGFDSDTAWTKGTGWTISGGAASANISAGTNLDQSLTTTINKTYQVTFTISNYISGSIRARFTGSANINGAVRSAVGTYTELFLATATNNIFRMVDGGAGFVGAIDNISVRELPGNHAAQSVLAQQPLYAVEPVTGRRNLLTYTEQFDNAVWAKSTGTTVSANSDTAPDGTVSADTINSTGNQIELTGTCSVSTTYTNSLYIKKTVGASYTPGLYLLFTGGTTTIYAALLNTDTGEAVAVSAGGFTAPEAVAAVDAGDYWRVSVTGASVNNTSVTLRLYPNLNAGGGAFAGSQIIWGAQLELGSTATAYQRVVSAQDVSEAGVAARPYLFFDGIDDRMATGASLTLGQVHSGWAGVRVLPFNSGVNSPFWALTPTVAPSASRAEMTVYNNSGNYVFRSIYPGIDTFSTGRALPSAPASMVISQHRKGGTELIQRHNGGQNTITTVSADFAEPNFVILGQHGVNGQYMYAQLYGLIIRGAAPIDAQIAAAERWMAQRTGVVI